MAVSGQHRSASDREAIKADIRNGVAYGAIRKKWGVATETMTRLRREVEAEKTRTQSLDSIVYPEHPDDDISTEDIIRLMSRRYRHREEAAKSRDWQTVKIKGDGPILSLIHI